MHHQEHNNLSCPVADVLQSKNLASGLPGDRQHSPVPSAFAMQRHCDHEEPSDLLVLYRVCEEKEIARRLAGAKKPGAAEMGQSSRATSSLSGGKDR